MFGYINVDKPNMLIKDFTLYRAFYCGICINMGKRYGQIKRLLTNYDVTFLAAFTFGFLGEKVEFKKCGCVLNPITKKAVVEKNKLLDRICDITVLLAAYKLKDDIQDEGKKSRRFEAFMLKRAIKKAKKNEPIISKRISVACKDLQLAENKKSTNLDELAHPFSSMLGDIMAIITDNKNEYIYNIFYNLGRWIYFIDGIDDLEKDFKNKSFNPFINAFGNFKDANTFVKNNEKDLTFLINSAYNAIKHNYEFVELKDNEGVITNILWYGLLQSSERVLKCEKCQKLKMSRNT